MPSGRKSRIFHPASALNWWEFALGTVLGGVLLGIGWSIGSKITNHFLEEHKKRGGYGDF